ncbi:MAG: hypothetical protein KTR29_10695 [Rhodothermaceae bacterium]|nr:hypothetical protein [Rhodothermaceae bacterium]
MTNKKYLDRRRFLKILTAGSALAIPVGWGCSTDSGIVTPSGIALTPSQTEGPFYPTPSIEQQMFNDTDLTRKLPTDVLAQGQLIVLDGVVQDRNEQLLENAVVEIWQASSMGLYNHPNDNANNPSLDQHFQFWGRAITGVDGKYSFSTIVPGEYDGRTARHIHFRVDAPGYRRLTTQSYFANYGARNAMDGLYSSLNSEGRDLLTVEFSQPANEPWAGVFNIVLAEA